MKALELQEQENRQKRTEWKQQADGYKQDLKLQEMDKH